MDQIISQIPRALLLLTAASFIILGVIGLLNPVGTLASLDILITTNVAKTELRATYGGFMFGVGLVFVYAALVEGALRFGLWAMMLMLFSVGISRIAGMIVDGSMTSMQWRLLGTEFVFALLALAALSFHSLVKIRA